MVGFRKAIHISYLSSLEMPILRLYSMTKDMEMQDYLPTFSARKICTLEPYAKEMDMSAVCIAGQQILSIHPR